MDSVHKKLLRRVEERTLSHIFQNPERRIQQDDRKDDETIGRVI